MKRFILTNRTLASLLLLLLLISAACSNPEATPASQPESTETAVSATETPAPPTATAEPAATNTPEPAPAASFEAADCEFNIPPERDVTCGWLTVPEDRSMGADGPTIQLHVAIFASDSPNPNPDPIVYLEGGPGGDALETIPLTFEQRFAPFLANNDFIMFDQRGTGYSKPSLACTELFDLTFETIEQTASAEEEVTQASEALASCHARLEADGVNLAAYNSAASAADLADLRVALGYDEWNLFGISYGTRLAQTVVRDNPAGVRSVILDSTFPLEVNLLADTPANVNRAFDVFFAGCAADPACNEAYPDLETVFFDLVDRLDAEPIKVPVFYLFTGDQYETPINGRSMINILFQSLYSAEIIPILPQLIYEVAAGETDTLGLVFSNFLAGASFSSIGMQYSVQCYEEIPFSSAAEAEEAAAAYPELAPYFDVSINLGQPAFSICNSWDSGTAPTFENQPVSSDIPTLIVAGEYDPITPPSCGEQLTQNFSNSYFFSYTGLGHGASISSDCSANMALAFIADPNSEPDDSCTAGMAGPSFVVPTASVNTAVTLVPFTADLGVAQISGVIPEGWEEAGPGIYARGEAALDQTYILQQATPGISAADLITALASQFGLEEVPESTGSISVGGRDWTLYQSEVQGSGADIALAEDGGLTYVVILSAADEDRDFLYDIVFLPALEAVTAE